MKLLLIHLSDFHAKLSGNSSLDKIPKIADAVKNLDGNVQTVVVAFSGDLAHGGTKEEYGVIEPNIAQLLRLLKTHFPDKNIEFIAVPGNHDCDFKNDLVQAREMILDGLGRDLNARIDEKTLGLCCGVHSHFLHFLDRMQTRHPDNKVSGLYYEYLVPVGTSSVLLRCYNTAFASTNPELPGQMVFPVSSIPNPPRNVTPDYAIAIFHHPYNWLTPNTKRQFAAHIESTADLVLTGHEHQTAYYKKEAYSGASNHFIEGAVFQESGLPLECGFNVVLIDLAVSQEKILKFQWDHHNTYFEKHDISDWRQYRKSRRLDDFKLTDAMLKRLDDPGATYSHPAKPELVIDDIYVAPNAEEMVFKNGKELTRAGVITSQNLISTISERKKVFVIGRERSGKSTLAKILFKRFFAEGLLPVMLEGAQITKPDIDRFTDLVLRRIKEDYQNPLLDKFQQQESDRIVIIIDDLDHTEKLNAKGRLKLLDEIQKRYKRVVVLGDDLLRLEEIAYGDLGAKVLSDYTQIEIKEYGHVLRSALIDKWYDINNEYSTNPELLKSKIASAEQIIDEIIKRSYLPAYPIFILTILQGIDSSQPIGNSAASYGYLYQVLITDRLSRAASDISLDKKLGYLCELAFHLFKRRLREISAPEFSLFHTTYCAEFPSVDQEKMFGSLERAGILEIYDNHIRFKYSYFYYYFVAQYLQRHIDDDTARKVIIGLCDDFDKEEHANIWLFLTHGSRSQFLLETIVTHAKKFFAEIASPRFDEDVAFLQKLYDKVPDLVLVNKSFEELRKERRARLDAESNEEPKFDPDATDTAKNEAIRMIAQLKAAVRTLEVMGQIVKNFAGSMRSDPRYTLVKECYELGLRVTGMILKGWETSGEQFVKDVLSIIIEREGRIETREELEAQMKSLIFFFCETVSVGLLKRISQAVGTKDLTETYQRLLKDNYSNAYRLIDLSIKLDHYSLPTGEVFELNDDFRENVFCRRLLCKLVLHHFYLFSSTDQTKQRVCQRLGIKMDQLRQVDFKTRNQKRLSSPG